MKKTLGLVGLMLFLAGCSQQEENVTIEYELVSSGAQDEVVEGSSRGEPIQDEQPENERVADEITEEESGQVESPVEDVESANDLNDEVTQRFPDIFTLSSIVTNLISDIGENQIIINKHAISEEVFEQYQYFYIPPSERTNQREYLFELKGYEIGEVNAILQIELQDLENLNP